MAWRKLRSNPAIVGLLDGPGRRLALKAPHQCLTAWPHGGNAPGLVAGQQLGHRAASRFILEIDGGQRLPVIVADILSRRLVSLLQSRA
jgi:hypothetical protein